MKSTIAKDIWEVKKKKRERMTHPACYYDIFKHSNKQDGTGGGQREGWEKKYIYICQWDKVYSTTQRGKERKRNLTYNGGKAGLPWWSSD